MSSSVFSAYLGAHVNMATKFANDHFKTNAVSLLSLQQQVLWAGHTLQASPGPGQRAS